MGCTFKWDIILIKEVSECTAIHSTKCSMPLSGFEGGPLGKIR